MEEKEEEEDTSFLPITAHMAERDRRFVESFVEFLSTAPLAVGLDHMFKHEYGSGIPLLFIAIILFLVGFFWQRLSALFPAAINQTATGVAKDFRWWLGIVFILILYFAAQPLAAQFVRPSEPKKETTYLTADPDPWDGRPLGISWRSADLRLVASISPTYSLTIPARNLGDDEVSLKAGYIISRIDSSRINMVVGPPNGESFALEDANPVPPRADLFLTANFPEKLSQQSLTQKWGSFSVIVEYDDRKVRHDFSREWTALQFTRGDPASLPHISKKQK
jgi:hypothetical protein